jgi:cytochrome c peroxidase
MRKLVPRFNTSVPTPKCVHMPFAIASAFLAAWDFCGGAAIAQEAGEHHAPPTPIHNLVRFADPTGEIATFNNNGPINRQSAFFQSLGTNGRSCATCHVEDQAFSISPPQIRERFEKTRGRDPLFAGVDGANCPNARTSDFAAHSLLLKHGLIRISLAMPPNPQFTLSVVHDPYGCALVPDPATGQLMVSVYRRPLPTTNLRFLSTVMFDGRETLHALTNELTFAANLQSDLTHQAQSAISVHFQADMAPTAAQLADIVNFELGLSTAQLRDESAGSLDRDGALGGPLALANQTYYPAINDVLGADPSGAAFNPVAMTAFAEWANSSYSNAEPYGRAAARRAIAAGEALFNTAPLSITGVRGINDNAALGSPPSFKGTCTTCHDTPNVGDHSLPLPLDLGIGHAPQSGFENDPIVAVAIGELDEPNLPVFLVNGCSTPFSAGQPVSFYTTDPGKALISGLCSDLNRVKGPILRGLAARAPYFHNGAAATLLQAVNFYNQRFAMNLTDDQKRQLVVFLNSL